jgi:MoaA/NifB/PqqE/SkfB family radical SAM enzyme
MNFTITLYSPDDVDYFAAKGIEAANMVEALRLATEWLPTVQGNAFVTEVNIEEVEDDE